MIPLPPARRGFPISIGLLALVAAGCGSSGGGSTTSPGGNFGPSVEFGSAAQNLVEDAGPLEIEVVMTAAASNDVTVSLQLGGTAMVVDDFALDTLDVTIPAGDVSGRVTLTPTVGDPCEAPETVVLTIASATGANLGGLLENTTTLIDADAEDLAEAEPNDGVASANEFGMLPAGRCLEIAGTIQEGSMDPFDVFELDVPAEVRVDVQLRPQDGAMMDLLLLVTDASGAPILPPIQDEGAGEDEAVSFTVDPALYPEINLVVSTFGPLGDYRLSVVASTGPAPLTAGPSRPADWAELKESLRRGVRPGEPGATLVGVGLVLDPESSELRPCALVAPARR